MNKPRISLFFGAGAEIGYGLPSGGKFALDLFRTPVDEDKAHFKDQLTSINNTSTYATKWLPDDYLKKRLHVFGKSDFEGIITSSLEYRKDDILHYLDHFDKNTSSLLQNWCISEDEVREIFLREIHTDLGQVLYGQAIKLNSRLAESVMLFNSEFFSAFLKVLETRPDNRDLQRHVRAILELLVGSCGQRLIAKLNEELFEAAPERLGVFDDLSGIFSLNYHNIGQTGMEIVLEEKPRPVTSSSTLEDIMVELSRVILEDIYAKTIDYQSLIDNHYRYLYNPKAQWAKFTRISIFLHTVRRYISSNAKIDETKLLSGPGYYHDLSSLTQLAAIDAIGTTNYNRFIKDIVGTTLPSLPIYHLNGSVEEFYDPYCNLILEGQTTDQLVDYEHLLVPFIFTQSGIKPLTSITMSKRYVELYDRFYSSDIICIVGYGFNGDDGHINGLFRSLASSGKKLVILHYGNESPLALKRQYQAKLRLSLAENLDILCVDNDRKVAGLDWWKALVDQYSPLQPIPN